MNIKSALHCDISVTTISKNEQLKANCIAIVFWNQGNSFVLLDANIRLAPGAFIATAPNGTPLYQGGEAYRFEHPRGRMIMHNFNINFIPGSNQSGQPDFNNLTVQMLIDLDDAQSP